MGVSEAQWVVENINGNMPEGLSTPLTLTYKRSKQSWDKGKGGGGGYGKSGGKGWAPAGGKDWGGKGGSPYGGGKDGGGGGACRNFQQYGECKFGANCKFSH